MNIDRDTVDSFGSEWSHFTQESLDKAESERLFESYFHIFPWHVLPEDAKGFDMGCGSGRWAKWVAPKVGHLSCIDPSSAALEVARVNLSSFTNVSFINAGVADHPLAEKSQDFGYSLGVLHHVPDTKAAMRECVKFLKPRAPFLVYLYYNFDNRPRWYYFAWKISDLFRRLISRLPEGLKFFITDLIATIVYFPLSRFALFGSKLGLNVDHWILSSYRNNSYYTLRTDSRDRFGTPLEQRFSRHDIEKMMLDCGLEDIIFSNQNPFWCAVGQKKEK